MRKLSESSLTNAALHYLRRYSATRKRLTQILERKVQRHVRLKGGVLDEAKPIIAKVVERMVNSGYVDDARLAVSRSESMHRKGKSVRAIRVSLKQKGVEAAVVTQTAQSTPERELEAAKILVKRRKLGRLAERKVKDLAVLMRAGFPYPIAKKALQEAQATTPT